MHYYKRNIGDYAKKAGRLSMLEHGAYTLLIDACYDREQFPTLEEALDWAWARTEVELAAVKFVLSKFFTLIDGVYVQKRIKEELDEYKEKAEINARIAQEREANRKKNKQTVNEHARTVNESCEKTHEPPPNHKPITNNQEPITNNQVSISADAPKTKKLGLSDLIALGVERQTASDWLEVRKVKRAALTQTALNLLISESAKAGITVDDAVKVCAENSWQGFKADWYKNLNKPVNKQEPISKHGGFGQRDYSVGINEDGSF